MTEQYLPKNINGTVTGDQLQSFTQVSGTITNEAAAIQASNAGGGSAITLTLPSAADYQGRSILWFNVAAGAGNEAVNVTAAAGETVGGLATLPLTAATVFGLVASAPDAWLVFGIS